VLDVAEHDLRETEIEPLGAERAAVDVALKVRALLFRRRERASLADAAPPSAVATSPVVAPLASPAVDVPAVATSVVAAPAVTSPDVAAPAVATPAVVVARPSAERPVRHRLGLSAAYEAIDPSDRTWQRHALQFGVALRLGRGKLLPLSLFVDGAWSTRPATTVSGFSVTMSDVPIGAGLLVTRAWSAVGVAAGPRASLHVFDISARDDNRSGSSRRYAVGVGGVARADVSLTTYMKVYLAASIEALVPKQQFTIMQQSAVDTGAMATGISAGFEWLLL